MSKKIDFAFKIDGFYESVNYYRSETPMDTSAMPVATATDIAGLNYTDNTIINLADYYIRFGAVRSGVEKISEEIKILLAPRYLIDMKVVSGAIVESGSLDVMWTINGSTSIASDSVTLPLVPGSYVKTDTVFNMSKNFEIEIEFLRKSNSPSSANLFGNGGVVKGVRATGAVDFLLAGPNSNPSYANRVSTVGAFSLDPINYIFAFDTYYKVKIIKSGLFISLYVNDVLSQTETIRSVENSAANFNLSPLILGWGAGYGDSSQFVGNIKSFKLLSYN